MGTAVEQCLRCCAANRKVAGSPLPTQLLIEQWWTCRFHRIKEISSLASRSTSNLDSSEVTLSLGFQHLLKWCLGDEQNTVKQYTRINFPLTSQNICKKCLYVHSNVLFYVENIASYNMYLCCMLSCGFHLPCSLESVGSVTDILLCYGSRFS